MNRQELIIKSEAYIRNLIKDHIPTQARLYLYGSRVDDTAKGGDIDLLVLSRKINLMAKLDILAQLHQKLLMWHCLYKSPFALSLSKCERAHVLRQAQHERLSRLIRATSIGERTYRCSRVF